MGQLARLAKLGDILIFQRVQIEFDDFVLLD